MISVRTDSVPVKPLSRDAIGDTSEIGERNFFHFNGWVGLLLLALRLIRWQTGQQLSVLRAIYGIGRRVPLLLA